MPVDFEPVAFEPVDEAPAQPSSKVDFQPVEFEEYKPEPKAPTLKELWQMKGPGKALSQPVKQSDIPSFGELLMESTATPMGPVISGEPLAEDLKLPRFEIDPKASRLSTIAPAAANLAIGAAEFATGPKGAAALTAGLAAPIPTAIYFTLDMAKGMLQEGSYLWKNWDKLTPSQQTEGLVNEFGTAALVSMIGFKATKDISNLATESTKAKVDLQLKQMAEVDRVVRESMVSQEPKTFAGDEKVTTIDLTKEIEAAKSTSPATAKALEIVAQEPSVQRPVLSRAATTGDVLEAHLKRLDDLGITKPKFEETALIGEQPEPAKIFTGEEPTPQQVIIPPGVDVPTGAPVGGGETFKKTYGPAEPEKFDDWFGTLRPLDVRERVNAENELKQSKAKEEEQAAVRQNIADAVGKMRLRQAVELSKKLEQQPQAPPKEPIHIDLLQLEAAMRRGAIKPEDGFTKLIDSLESKKVNSEGEMYALGIPGIAKSVWNTGLDIAIRLVRAGMSINEAIDSAIEHFRKNADEGWSEKKAYNELRYAIVGMRQAGELKETKASVSQSAETLTAGIAPAESAKAPPKLTEELSRQPETAATGTGEEPSATLAGAATPAEVPSNAEVASTIKESQQEVSNARPIKSSATSSSNVPSQSIEGEGQVHAQEDSGGVQPRTGGNEPLADVRAKEAAKEVESASLPTGTLETKTSPREANTSQEPSVGKEAIPPRIKPSGEGEIGITVPGAQSLEKVFDAAKTARAYMSQQSSNRPTRRQFTQEFDGAETAASMTARQAHSRIALGTTPLDRKAITFIIEANGNRARLVDFANKVRGKNTEAYDAIVHAEQNWDALQPKVAKAKFLLADQLKQERVAGMDVDTREGYVPHMQDMDVFMGNGRPILIAGHGGGLSTAFKKGRTFETYADSIEAGYKPKSLDAAALIEHRIKVGQKLINRRNWVNSFRGVNDPVSGEPVVTSLIRKPKGSGSREFSEVAPLGYTTREILPGIRVAIHESYSRLFDALTGQSHIPPELLKIAGGIKHGMLVFDTFHAGRMMQKELALTGRTSFGTRMKSGLIRKGQALLDYSDADLAEAVAQKEITPEMAAYAKANRPTAELLIKNGLNVGRIQENMYNSWIRNVRVLGPFNKWVFEKLTRSAMLEGAIREFDRIKSKNSGLSDKQIALQVSKHINTLFGNLGKQGFLKSNTALDISRLLMLAPQWVESMARTEVGSFKGLTYDIARDAVKGQPVIVGTLAKHMGQGLLGYVAATQIANIISRGYPTWDNPEPGHQLDAWIPDITGKTPGYFFSPLSTLAELTHDMIRYYHSEGGIAQAGTKILSNKASPFSRAVIALGGYSWDGKKLVTMADRAKAAAVALMPTPIPLSPVIKGAQPGQMQRQLMASAGFKAEPAPTAEQQMRNKLNDWMKSSTDPRIQESYRRGQQEVSAESPLKNLKIALRAGDIEDAKDEIVKILDSKIYNRSRLNDYFNRWQGGAMSGSPTLDAKFRRSLTPEELKVYQEARAERRKQVQVYRQARSMMDNELKAKSQK